MRVLHFAAYVTIDNYPGFSRSTSGYGYMTIDIATAIARRSAEVGVEVLTQANLTAGMDYKGLRLLKHTWKSVLTSMRLSDAVRALKTMVADKTPLRKLPNILLYHLSVGYFLRMVRNNRYDLIHIHGIDNYTAPVIRACDRYGFRYLVTLHGLNSFNDSIRISAYEKQLEKELLLRAQQHSLPLTVISTGIKTTIVHFLEEKIRRDASGDTSGRAAVGKMPPISVIPNAVTERLPAATSPDLYTTYAIPTGQLILLCVGNLSFNKNQLQVARAFQLLPDEVKQQLTVLFLGYDTTGGQLEAEINSFNPTAGQPEAELNNSNSTAGQPEAEPNSFNSSAGQPEMNRLHCKLIVAGNIPRQQMAAYYQQAHFNVLASIREGFGMSIIEALQFGMPTLTFSDLDAVPDVYHPETMVVVDQRTDEALAQGMVELISRKWDKDRILQQASLFSAGAMADRYLALYKKLTSPTGDQRLESATDNLPPTSPTP